MEKYNGMPRILLANIEITFHYNYCALQALMPVTTEIHHAFAKLLTDCS